MAVGPMMTRVLEAGQGDRVIVFVHGTGGRADRWSRNLDAFAKAGFHAYAFDLPGHGYASKGAGVDCSVPAYRHVLGAFMDAVGIRKAVIVGTSLGGHVVASYACENPSRIDAVVLVGSMGLVPIGDEARGRIQAGANNQSRDGIVGKLLITEGTAGVKVNTPIAVLVEEGESADAAGWGDGHSLYARLASHGWLVALPALLGLTAMSVAGDLVESLVKRSAGVKDSSQLLPGHGGVLDRVDALVPVLPLAMMLSTF